MPLHLIEFAGDENTITNCIITAYIPSADVAYDKDYVGLPQSSALYISSNNNLLDNVTVSVDGTSVAEGSYYPSIDAIDFQSTGKGVVIENNTITNSKVIATGSNYVYGINVGRAKDTTTPQPLPMTRASRNSASSSPRAVSTILPLPTALPPLLCV